MNTTLTRSLLGVAWLAAGMTVIHLALSTPAVLQNPGVTLAIAAIGLGMVIDAKRRRSPQA